MNTKHDTRDPRVVEIRAQVREGTGPAKLETEPQIVQIRPLYLRKPDVARYFGISVALWDQLMARGNFGAPRPRRLGKRTSVWLVDELDAWGRSLPVSDLLPPSGAGWGRRGKPD